MWDECGASFAVKHSCYLSQGKKQSGDGRDITVKNLSVNSKIGKTYATKKFYPNPLDAFSRW